MLEAADALSLFAPILAEKERIARCWEKECEERTSIGKMALDRALAAEAALAAERERAAITMARLKTWADDPDIALTLQGFPFKCEALQEDIRAAIRGSR